METSKQEIREWAKSKRYSIGKEKINKTSQDIVRKIKKSDVYKSAKNIMSYYAKDLEVSLNDLLSDSTKNWFLPVAKNLNSQNELLVIPYKYGETKLVKSAYGIFEPQVLNENTSKAESQIIDLIFVPGLCFDKNGYRVGYGKGFYDNFLKRSKDSVKIGLCLKELLLEEIPVDEWDEKVDFVITD